jgi:hypothetical protein
MCHLIKIYSQEVGGSKVRKFKIEDKKFGFENLGPKLQK